MIAKHDYKILDGRVIAAYSLGQIVLPKSNNLERLGFASSLLTYSISGELFGHDYRTQLPYHQLIFSSFPPNPFKCGIKICSIALIIDSQDDRIVSINDQTKIQQMKKQNKQPIADVNDIAASLIEPIAQTDINDIQMGIDDNIGTLVTKLQEMFNSC
jgi:hypothetical protein